MALQDEAQAGRSSDHKSSRVEAPFPRAKIGQRGLTIQRASRNTNSPRSRIAALGLASLVLDAGMDGREDEPRARTRRPGSRAENANAIRRRTGGRRTLGMMP